MNNRNLVQAYKLTPWRRQIQIIGIYLAAVAIVLTGAGIYLYVTASAATIGREIQDLQDEKQALQQSIENNRSKLAVLSSARLMVERAEELGFIQVNSSSAMYIVVPEYSGKQEVNLAAPSLSNSLAVQPILPSYTLTLFDWVESLLDDIVAKTEAGQ